MNAFSLAGILTTALVVIAIVAAISDVRERRIPNWTCVTIAVLALMLHASDGLVSASFALGVGIAALAGAIVIRALGMVGAGDAKLFGALSVWMGVQQFPGFLGALAVAAMALSLYSIATRGGRLVLASSSELSSLPKRVTLPFGLALSAAAIWSALGV